jgi:hypothetical protein
MSDLVSIQSIIDLSSKHAPLCRDILRYCTIKFEGGQPLKQFDITEIGNWLIKNHQPFVDYYTDSKSHTRNSYRLHTKRTYIKDRIEDLISLKLINIEGKEKSRKNDTRKNVYYFTVEGTFIAWLIEAYSRTGEYRSKAITMLLGTLLAQFRFYDISSFGRFMLDFISKNGDSEEIRSTLLDNKEFLLSLCIEKNPRKARQLFLAGGSLNNLHLMQAFKKSLMEMSEQSQKLLLFQFKLDVESNEIWHINEDWELMRYNNINNHSKVTLLGACRTCKAYPFVFDLFEFISLRRTFKSTTQGIYDIKRIKCKRCGKPNGLSIIPTWLNKETKNFAVFKDAKALAE